jgi:multicomponent Na+:H+ antiporter subunit D
VRRTRFSVGEVGELSLEWAASEDAVALLVTVALPLLGGGAVLLLRRHPNIREAASLLSGVAVAAVVLSLWPVADDGLRFDLWTWLPGFSLGFALEPLGLLFATVAAVLWPLTSVFSIGYMRGTHQQNQTRFYFYFALAIAAAMWVALSANLVTLFIGYEVLTLVTWPLVSHQGGIAGRRGGRTYLVLLLVTSMGLLLPAIVWTGLLAGTTEFRAGGLLAGQAGPGVLAVLFALYLFGIGKAALMPFHNWLPAAMVAPTPVSALLHAVAVVKAGVFAVLKVSVYVFGLDTLSTGDVTTVMRWVAAGTLLVAGVLALRSDDLKRCLAYSTVSQLAYVVLAATLVNDVAFAGGALHMMTHAVGKITLFFCAGAIFIASGKSRVSELDGLGRAMPWTFAAFLVAALSIVGMPPMGGMWSKWLLLLGTAEAGQVVMIAVLLVGSLLSLGYLMPIVARAFFRPLPGGPVHGEAPLTVVLPPVVTAAGCAALFFGAEFVIAPLASVVELP